MVHTTQSVPSRIFKAVRRAVKADMFTHLHQMTGLLSFSHSDSGIQSEAFCCGVYCQRVGGSDVDSSQINSISNYSYAKIIISQSPSEVPMQSWYPKNGMSFRQPLDRNIHISDEADFDDVSENENLMADTPSDNSEHDDNTRDMNEDDLLDIDNDEDDVKDEDDGVVDPYYWGYGVSQILVANDTHREQSRCIVRSKLLLDHSVHTKHIRKQL
ncbi:hypothetical protein TSTA_112050 [Talaromyces stipitatus ATCC 10500]|uniref:Uncharacterized protein n=1 Tax=Talaromyces stipitatus (strain ATCC 10500 / CBS 375.48 / QM 6759 / NRRL 1006) TaxID=441959 RepID=B8M974_TALSN|nr:uncharacterized protein TSTA_112050 [Talaromyces stipitatus ATCC 10500]EED17369.1 hypothetical protein TSTA_112050 [Talaromyces stipitatus ATCC 10500]